MPLTGILYYSGPSNLRTSLGGALPSDLLNAFLGVRMS